MLQSVLKTSTSHGKSRTAHQALMRVHRRERLSDVPGFADGGGKLYGLKYVDYEQVSNFNHRTAP